MPTDAEVICGFMEPRPDLTKAFLVSMNWWVTAQWMRPAVVPRHLDLDALREVEEKLDDAGEGAAIQRAYAEACRGWIWHLTVAEKTGALARVIRGIK